MVNVNMPRPTKSPMIINGAVHISCGLPLPPKPSSSRCCMMAGSAVSVEPVSIIATTPSANTRQCGRT